LLFLACIGETLADFHSDWSRPDCSAWLKISHSVICPAHSLRSRDGIPSGPLAFDVSKLLKQLGNLSTLITMSESCSSVLNGGEPLTASRLVLDRGDVNTEEKYVLKSYALGAAVCAVSPL
jgi:hypothetical protein